MYNQNSDQKSSHQMSPRISFSNDFVETSSHSHTNPVLRNAYRDAPVSSDFEFSVSNYSMRGADELFCKGRLLPLKEQKTTTLRDELQNGDEDDNGNNSNGGGGGGEFSLRPPKNPARWRGFLGLRKAHSGSKNKSEKVLEKRSGVNYHDADDDDVQCSKNSQDFVD